MTFNSLTHFIVIETRQDTIYDAYYYKYKQDLVIVNPITNIKYKISTYSNCLQLYSDTVWNVFYH